MLQKPPPTKARPELRRAGLTSARVWPEVSASLGQLAGRGEAGRPKGSWFRHTTGSATSPCSRRARPRGCPSPQSSEAGTTTTARPWPYP
eukprot:scaffold29068_cov42-Phaeocystis_antarctica.AAC.1